MQDVVKFYHSLSELSDQPLSRQDAADAFYNLTGFMGVLLKINEREQIIPTRTNGSRHANH